MDIIKFIKFGIVGILGLVIDFFITWLCKEKLKVDKFISNSFGFIVAAICNYFLNKYFTFHNHSQNVTLQLLIFISISALGLLFNTFIIYLLQNKTKLNFYLCKLIAIGIVFIWNFFANSFFTFR